MEYFFVELITGLTFPGLWYYFSPALNSPWNPLYLKFVIFFSLLIMITVIDIHHRIIPDSMSIGGIVIGLLFSFYPHSRVILIHNAPLYVDIWKSLLGILIGGGFFLLVAIFYEKVKKVEGLGGGDIKLMGMVGAFLGAQSILFIMIASSVLGLIYGLIMMVRKKSGLQLAIPFGPFICISAGLFVFFGKYLGERFILFP